MQDEINNIEKPDAFSKFVRQKLENHQLPVNAGSWNEIESQMKTQKTRILPFWFWISGVAAAAIFALLFILHQPSEIKTIALKTIKNNTTIVQPKHVAASEKGKTAQNQLPKINQINQLHNNQTYTNLNIKNPEIKSSNKDTVVSNTATPDLTKTIRKNNELSAEVSAQNKDSILKNKRIIPNSLVDKSSNEAVIKKENKNEWLLAATFGSGDRAPDLGNSNYDAAILNPYYKNIVSSETNFTTGLIDSKAFSKITYNPALSFGLVIRKTLDKTISLESGLVYTYLSTNFENNDVQQNYARLHLHYIGIPLNLVGVLWRNSRWEIYISGGAMVEKGIRSVYVLNQIYGNQTFTTTASTGIDGFQWSVNGAVGTTYKLQQNIGLFFEPKISYFFNDNQPISARTDQPTVIGLTAGIRFQF
jgi:hypothetical protein